MEYRFDGLRFDAVHAILDPDWLDEMAAKVRATVEPGRHVHLVLEHHNDALHLSKEIDAQWNDDGHNVLHALLTGEDGGYYLDYADEPAGKLARCLAKVSSTRENIPATWANRAACPALICRRLPLCCSCRTMIRSATGHSASG